jgi:DNA-binding response OmpR family regulator
LQGRTAVGITLLVVDDDPNVREILTGFADARGHRVLGAASSAEALVRTRESRPDAIILDVMMPRAEGPAILAALRHAGYAHIPVVMLSAIGGDFTRERCMQLGAVGYFTKPFSGVEVLDQVERLLKGTGRSDGTGVAYQFLIADDDELVRRLFKDQAAARGHRVIEANHGTEVLPLVRRARPDLIVLDVMLPRMDGPAVLEALHQAGLGAVPVVMLTAAAGPFTRERCMQLGATDYFVKPYRATELFGRIEGFAARAKEKKANRQA